MVSFHTQVIAVVYSGGQSGHVRPVPEHEEGMKLGNNNRLPGSQSDKVHSMLGSI